MSNEGTNELQVGQETTTDSSIFPQYLETDDFLLDDEIFNYFTPSLSSSISPLHHHQDQQQQQGPSTGPSSHIVPSFGEELDKSFQTPISSPELSSFQDLEHLDQFRNVEMEANFEELFDVAIPHAQGTITGLGGGSYHMPISNSTPELMFEPSPTVQPPSTQQGYSQNPLGVATSASSPSLPMTQTPLAENPNLQHKSGQGKRETKEKTQSQLLNSFYPLAMANITQNQVPNTQRQGLLGTKPIPDKLKIGGSSSSARNVRMKMTLSDNIQQLAAIQVGNPPALPNNDKNLAPIRIGNPNVLPNKDQQSSSRNVRMKMTVSDNIQQLGAIQVGNPCALPNNNQQLAPIQIGNPPSLLNNDQQLALSQVGKPPTLPGNGLQLVPVQFGSLQNPPAQGNENPPPPPRTLQSSLYDPIYEQLGFPVDLTLRMYLASKRNRGDS